MENLTEKPKIKGAIIIYSCHKHKNTRLKEFCLPQKEYLGWKVFTVIGNPHIEPEFEIEGNMITLRCEDSYLHILKKVVMGIKAVYAMYDVEEGVLRTGDDILFNENRMVAFLQKTDKTDYMGIMVKKTDYGVLIKGTNAKIDYFMPNYYSQHLEDLTEYYNNLKITYEDILKLHIVPAVNYAGGAMFYISNKSCKVLVEHLESVDWDIYKYYEKDGYPYIVEDIGVGYILDKNNIPVTNYVLYTDLGKPISNESIAIHTNKYR